MSSIAQGDQTSPIELRPSGREIPPGGERCFDSRRRALRRMEKKINTLEVCFMLEEFINRSFMPNQVDIKFKSIFNLNSKQINLKRLLKDFQKLYFQPSKFDLFSEHAEVLIIKSKNDFILKEYAFNEFINLLNNSQINKPKLVQIENQGHIIDNNCIVNILKDWL